ncbi:MAG: M48 family metalloprotease [Vicinamibacteria bacterium]|nr:M48 family metalloprotease [Vicinamibacteria bacterium]
MSRAREVFGTRFVVDEHERGVLFTLKGEKMRMRDFGLTLTITMLLLWAVPSGAGDNKVSLDGYAEWHKGDILIVDGQRVKAGPNLVLRGDKSVQGFARIPLGYEVKVKGERLEHGTIMANEIEVKPNGVALFEGELQAAFDKFETRYRERGRMCEEDENGNVTSDYGRLLESGPYVARVRRIALRIIPPYLQPEDFRIYVIENKEWNAMAAPNRSIYVFTGLLDDMSDDEVAIIIGHEVAHVTHEHSRKQFKKDILIKLAALGVVVAAEAATDDKTKKTVIQIAALLGASAWKNGYGRGHEDQSDRVGLRYAYEGGYDVHVGPRLWKRFSKKYGDTPKLINFFINEHSVSSAREKNLLREVALNYE